MPNNFKFLEIGVYKGRIISQIGLLSKIINKKCSIYGITPLSTAGDKYSKYVDNNYLEIIQNNFKKLNTNITNLTIIKGYSQDAKVVEKALNKSKYNMIFIDGSHDYNDVIFDILTYSKMLTINGYLIMDDSSLYLPDSYGMFKGHPDVSKACIDYLDTNPNFEELYAIGHNRVWKKIK
jgi:cephalosporin hydroxylase